MIEGIVVMILEVVIVLDLEYKIVNYSYKLCYELCSFGFNFFFKCLV